MSSSGGLKTITWPIVAKVVSEIRPAKPRKPRDNSDVRRKVRQETGVALIWQKGEQQNGWADKVAGNLEEDITGSELAAAHPESYGDLDGIDTRIPTIVLNEDRKLRKTYLAWEEGGRQVDEPTKPMDDEQLRRALNEAAYGTLAFLLDMDKALDSLDALATSEEAPAAIG